jgi:hypothetical protein
LHAVDLGAAPYSALAAASILSRTRELRVKAGNDLRRAYVMSDDPDERAQIAAQIASLESDRPGATPSGEGAQIDMTFIDKKWRKEAPFIGRGLYLMVGPSRDAYQCAGRDARERPECASEWEGALPSRREP